MLGGGQGGALDAACAPAKLLGASPHDSKKRDHRKYDAVPGLVHDQVVDHAGDDDATTDGASNLAMAAGTPCVDAAVEAFGTLVAAAAAAGPSKPSLRWRGTGVRAAASLPRSRSSSPVSSTMQDD